MELLDHLAAGLTMLFNGAYQAVTRVISVQTVFIAGIAIGFGRMLRVELDAIDRQAVKPDIRRH